ncbi:Protein Wnt-5 [Gryllus bimaculatus]|nr:Protein Wnt-5 [Gryllus bimaculatus]
MFCCRRITSVAGVCLCCGSMGCAGPNNDAGAFLCRSSKGCAGPDNIAGVCLCCSSKSCAGPGSDGCVCFYMGVLGPDAYIDAGAGACRGVPGLTRRQQRVCRDRPDHMAVVARAARSAILECQRQFRNSRWNCSTVRDRSVFGPVMQFDGAYRDMRSRLH